MSNKIHKCKSLRCNNMIPKSEIWCESCLNELGDLVEKYPIGYVPRKFK